MRVLFLHGVPTSGRLWDGVRRALGPDVETFAPDLAGFGAAPPVADPSPERLLAPLLPWVDARTHLVGQDLGGLLAAMIAARMPVASLTLSSTALGLGWLPAALTAAAPFNRYFYRKYAGRRWLELGVSPERRAHFLAQFPGADPAWMEAIARRLPLWAGHRLRPAAPTWCLWGAEDVSVPVVYARALAWRLGAGLTLLPGLRHYACWEGPERYAAALRGFWGGGAG